MVHVSSCNAFWKCKFKDMDMLLTSINRTNCNDYTTETVQTTNMLGRVIQEEVNIEKRVEFKPTT